MVKLVFNDQSGWERSVELNEQNNVVMIGRNADCGIQTSNASVSRVHAMVTWRGGKLFVQDPPNGRPTNGTKVDGMRLQPGEVLELFAGSELLCGNFAVHVTEDNAGGESVARMGEQATANVGKSGNGGGYTSGAGGQGGVHGGEARSGYGGQPVSAQPVQPPVVQPSAQPQPPQQARQGFSPEGRHGGYPEVGGRPSYADKGRGYVHDMQSRGTYGDENRVLMQDGRGGRQVFGGQPGASVSGGRGRYPGASPQAVSSVMPSVAAPDADELARLKEENANLRAEVEKLRAAKSEEGSSEGLQEMQEKLDEKEQLLSDCERRLEYHESVVVGLNEMIKNLKEQLEHQKEQYQECHKDWLTSQEEAENLKLELSSVKESLESKGMATTNAETAISDLKVQLQQKTRLLSDLQRELDLAQFSCKEERENVERLKENVDTLNASVEEYQRRNRDMKKVVEQHEMMFSEYKSNLDDRAREIRMLQDSLRKQGGMDNTALMQELSQVRENLNRKTSECEMYQKQLKGAEEAAGDNAAYEAEIADLKAKLAQMESGNAMRSAEAESRIKSLEADVASLTGENRDLSEALKGKEGACGSDMPNSGVQEKVRECLEGLNDVVSQWRMDLETLEDSINDLQRVFVAYVKIDVKNLSGQERIRLENVLKNYDPKAIFEDIGMSLDASHNSLQEIKDKLKALKGSI